MSLESFVSWRYLRSNERRKLRTAYRGLVSLALGGALLIAARVVGKPTLEELFQGAFDWQRLLASCGTGAIGLGAVVTFLGLLIASFSIFVAISAFGVFLGTCALVIFLSVMGGFESDLRTKILGANAHAVVKRPSGDLVDYRQVVGRVERVPGVRAAMPFLEGEFGISSPSNYAGVVLSGVDPELAARVTDLGHNLESGSLDFLAHPEKLRALGPPSPYAEEPPPRPPKTQANGAAKGSGRPDGEPGEPIPPPLPLPDKVVPPRPLYPGIIIGRELARTLRVYVGDDVNLVSPLGGMGPTGPIPKSKPFRVAGIFYSGMYEYDTKTAYVDLAAAQRFMGKADQASGVQVKVVDVEQATEVARVIAARLGGGYQVQDWKDLNRNLFSALKLEKISMFIVLTLIVVVASFSIILNLIMVVFEKGQEIAILKSMGARDGSVMKIFVLAGLQIGAIGMSVGLLYGVLTCLALDRYGLALDPEVYYIAKLPVRLDGAEIAVIAAAALCISLLAAIYPAWLAARLRPVEGLRYE